MRHPQQQKQSGPQRRMDTRNRVSAIQLHVSNNMSANRKDHRSIFGFSPCSSSCSSYLLSSCGTPHSRMMTEDDLTPSPRFLLLEDFELTPRPDQHTTVTTNQAKDSILSHKDILDTDTTCQATIDKEDNTESFVTLMMVSTEEPMNTEALTSSNTNTRTGESMGSTSTILNGLPPCQLQPHITVTTDSPSDLLLPIVSPTASDMDTTTSTSTPTNIDTKPSEYNTIDLTGLIDVSTHKGQQVTAPGRDSNDSNTSNDNDDAFENIVCEYGEQVKCLSPLLRISRTRLQQQKQSEVCNLNKSVKEAIVINDESSPLLLVPETTVVVEAAATETESEKPILKIDTCDDTTQEIIEELFKLSPFSACSPMELSEPLTPLIESGAQERARLPGQPPLSTSASTSTATAPTSTSTVIPTVVEEKTSTTENVQSPSLSPRAKVKQANQGNNWQGPRKPTRKRPPHHQSRFLSNDELFQHIMDVFSVEHYNQPSMSSSTTETSTTTAISPTTIIPLSPPPPESQCNIQQQQQHQKPLTPTHFYPESNSSQEPDNNEDCDGGGDPNEMCHSQLEEQQHRTYHHGEPHYSDTIPSSISHHSSDSSNHCHHNANHSTHSTPSSSTPNQAKYDENLLHHSVAPPQHQNDNQFCSHSSHQHLQQLSHPYYQRIHATNPMRPLPPLHNNYIIPTTSSTVPVCTSTLNPHYLCPSGIHNANYDHTHPMVTLTSAPPVHTFPLFQHLQQTSPPLSPQSQQQQQQYGIEVNDESVPMSQRFRHLLDHPSLNDPITHGRVWGVGNYGSGSDGCIRKPGTYRIRRVFNLDDKLHSYTPSTVPCNSSSSDSSGDQQQQQQQHNQLTDPSSSSSSSSSIPSTSSSSLPPDEESANSSSTVVHHHETPQPTESNVHATEATPQSTGKRTTAKRAPRKRKVKFFNNEFNQFISGTHKTQQGPSRDKYKFTKMYW